MQYCNDDGTICFDTSALAGNWDKNSDGVWDGDSGLMCEGDGEYMAGFISDPSDPQGVKPDCQKFKNVRDAGCSPDSFISHMEYDKTTGHFVYRCRDGITDGLTVIP